MMHGNKIKMATSSSRVTKTGVVYPDLSKHLSHVKRSHVLVSSVKLVFFGLYPFYKVEAVYTGCSMKHVPNVMMLTGVKSVVTTCHIMNHCINTSVLLYVHGYGRICYSTR